MEVNDEPCAIQGTGGHMSSERDGMVDETCVSRGAQVGCCSQTREGLPADQQGVAPVESLQAELRQDLFDSGQQKQSEKLPWAGNATPKEQQCPKKKGSNVLFNLSHSNYEVIPPIVRERGWRVVKSEEKASQCNVHWIDDGAIGDWLPRCQPWMRINHFPGMNNALARKTRLARNMARMQRLFPKEYNFLPPTWNLPDDIGELEKQFGGCTESKSFYIVKPDHLCQGRGIYLTTSLDRLRKTAVESRKKDSLAVVQLYLSRPMLIDGFKFDLRLYFLVCGKLEGGSAGLDLRMFLFRDGLVRLCTTQYAPPTTETERDKCMHLTNYAVNKESDDFQHTDSDETGSKRSLRWFLGYVEEAYGAKESRKLWLKLMGLCVKTILTVQPTLEAEYIGSFPRDLSAGHFGCRCFEVLGIDVMLDSRRKPYLIEINHLPSFTTDAPLDEDIKRRLIEQTLDITCGSISPKDRRTYEQKVRERRGDTRGAGDETPAPLEAAGDSPGGDSGDVMLPLLMDVPEYMDFERAYPPPEGATKLATHCETILARVKTLFKPVHAAVTTRSASKDVESAPSGSRPRSASRERAPVPARPRPQPPLKPALPPKLPSNAAPPAAAMVREPSAADTSVEPSFPEPPTSTAGPAVGRKSLHDPSRLTSILAQKAKRSRSEPRAARCALPPLPRGGSPRRSLSVEEGKSNGGSSFVQTHTPTKQAISRAVLHMKAVDIKL
mmetsp:Transcript_76798/g.151942  ORF Transcript_76798/g.151942 Transcript_76798/m.151942 type:complete len:723 (-) Transcript_76798:167-2335(-)